VNLLAGLDVTAGALTAYNRVLQVVQNNVANSSTPGYAQQTQDLVPIPFDVSTGSLGGVQAGAVISSRDQYLEQSVRSQTVLMGQAQQNVNSLSAVQSVFDVTGQSGISVALNNLYASFSAWAQTPTDNNAQQAVLNNATDVAQAFQQTSANLDTAAQNTTSQIQDTVSQVNQLVGQLQGFNKQILSGDRNDPSLDAQVNSTLEQLSQFVGFSALQQGDGSYEILMNGQTPLLVESTQYQIAYQPAPTPANAAFPAARPSAEIVSSSGTDITAQTNSGQLGALLNVANTVIPSYIGGPNQVGDLNVLAKQFADTVNGLLTSGNISDGDPANSVPATPGVPLFTYDTTNDTNVAASLAVSPTITPDQLAAIQPATGTTPEVSNGVALTLSQLANPQNSSEEGVFNGASISFTSFYGELAARVGNDLNTANGDLTVQQSAVAQAQNLRQQVSGVNLDQQAALLLQVQQAYDANSKFLSVLDEITSDVINMIQPALTS
jgi:flagellar hook-associated protein 1 FlgK